MSTIKDIDDVDDDLFVARKPQNYIFAEKKADNITERTNKMLANSRIIVQETEQVGQSTLENLATQRETLERVENDLDSINTMTRATQKHLNNMRSFFGGIKSLFGSNNSSAANQSIATDTKGAMPRSRTLANMSTCIPAAPQSSATNSPINPTRSSFGASSSSIGEKHQDEFEANLSEIGFGLGRLKEMAMKLGDEIGDQNDMLDRITDKSERAGDSVKYQNRQIQQLLKK